MSAPNTEVGDTRGEEKHQQAVARTLRWADEAAARGDHFEALSWLSTLEAVGHRLSPAHEAKRDAWRLALNAHRHQPRHDSER